MIATSRMSSLMMLVVILRYGRPRSPKRCEVYVVSTDFQEGDKTGYFPGKTVTIQMLLAANVLQPGKAAMSIEYLVSFRKITGYPSR